MFCKKSWAVSAVMAIMLLGATTYAGGGLMTKSDRSLIPKPDQALIVILRPHPSFGKSFWTDESLFSASVYDVSGNDTKLIGILKSGDKVCFDVAPGEYMLMVISESADFMKATVTTGKIYYALVIPRTGALKTRFSFKPLHQSDLADANFSKWNSNTDLIESTPEAETWAKRNAPDIERKRADYWPVWSTKPLKQRDAQTLKPEDGR